LQRAVAIKDVIQ